MTALKMLKFDQKAYREINLDKRQFRHNRLAEVRYSLLPSRAATTICF